MKRTHKRLINLVMDVKRISILRTVTPLLLIMLLGAIFRFTGIDWGIASLQGFRVDGLELSIQGAGFHPDANFLTLATKSLSQSIHPHHTIDGEERLYSVYGPVFMYLFWLVGKPLSWVAGFDLFNLQDFRDSNLTRLAGRSLSAIAGTLTILFTYLIGTRCYGRSAGLIAAFLLAITPLHIQSSHFCTVDVLVTLWMTVAFLMFLSVADRGKPVDYLISGGWIGVACATKLNALGMFVPLGVAHLVNIFKGTERNPEGETGKPDLQSFLKALSDIRIYLSLGACIALFIVLAPSSILRFADYFDPENMLTATNAILVNMGKNLMRGSFHFEGTPAYSYYVTNLFPAGMGIPMEIAVFAGIGWAGYRHRREDLLILSFVVLYFLATGRSQGKYIRYFVLWMPFVAILSARFLVDACGSGTRMFRIVGIAFASVVCLYTLGYGAAFTGIYQRSDVRIEAARWIAHNIPKGSVVLLEQGHNGMRELLSEKDLIPRTLDVDHHMAIVRPTVLIRFNYYTSAFYQLYVANTNYLVISDDRLAARGRRPFATMYYDKLMDGSFGHTLVREFQVTPTFLGIPFDDSSTDVTWRRFDHPKILVFRRNGEPRNFDLDYRSGLPVTTAQQVYELFRYAVGNEDVLVLYGCLLRAEREIVTPYELVEGIYKLKARPDLLDRLSEPRFAVRESDGWTIDLRRLGTEEAAKQGQEEIEY